MNSFFVPVADCWVSVCPGSEREPRDPPGAAVLRSMQSGLTTSLEKIAQAGQGKILEMWSHQSAASAEHYLMVDKVPPSFSSMELMRHVSRFILSAARSVGRPREGFTFETKCLRDGRRSMPDGCCNFRWHPGQANAERNFHDLLKAGTKAFWLL